MSKTITLSLPHDLPPDEVKRRVVTAIADARSKHPGVLKDAHERWTDNQIDFVARAMGKDITGRIVIEPRVVHVSVELPLILAMFASKIKPQLQTEGRKLLEQK